MGRWDRTQSASDFTNEEWRARPRKTRAAKLTARLSIRVSPSEYTAIEEQAEMAGMCLSDYVVCRALRRKSRIAGGDDAS